MNIKLKLTLLFTFVVATILGTSFYIALQNYSQFRQSNFYERLNDRAHYTTKAFLDFNSSDEVTIAALSHYNHTISPNLRLTIYDTAGIILEAIGAPVTHTETLFNRLLANQYIEEQINDTQYVYFAYRDTDKPVIVQAASYDKTGYYKVTYLSRIFILTWALSIITTAFVGWWFARISLRPMTQVMSNVAKITGLNLHKRLPINKPADEIAQLSITFNQMLDRLESAFILQKDFVSNASHEFRTPLTAIKGQVQVSLLKSRSTDEYQQLLRSLNDDIDNLIGLLNALQELAKANANAFPKTFAPVSILDIVIEIQNDFSKSKPHYAIESEVVESDQATGSVYCYGDANLLKSVITNLIDNACKFSPDFKCRLLISFTPTSIRLEVSDEGVGISEENLKHVFEPFFRGNDTRNVYGHGIGLSLVKKIVELHKGEISIRSVQGKGTTVTLELPVSPIS
jgi:signal transduction histidine kinase